MLPADMLTKVKFGKAPAWRECTDGLHIEGKCTNATCEAYEETIIDPKVSEQKLACV